MTLILILAAFPYTVTATEAVTDAALKAAYLLKFPHFVEWPGRVGGISGPTLRICVDRTSPVYPELVVLAEGMAKEARPEIKAIRLPLDVAKECDVLFFTEQTAGEQRRYLNRLKGQPVLTIGDRRGFASNGGMVEIVNLGKRLGFDINLKSTRASGFSVETNMLRLAGTVHTHIMQAQLE